MQEQSSGSTGNILLAFLAGAVLGGVVVALTTPKRGDELQADLKGMGERLKKRGGEALETAEKTYEEAREGAGQAFSDVKGGLREMAQNLRS